MDPSQEKGLLKGLRKMDEAAWRVFFTEYSRPLQEFLRLCLVNSADSAEEVTQMVLLRCVRSIATFDPARGRLWEWLKAVARNEARTFLRSAAKLPAASIETAAQAMEAIDRELLPPEILVRQDVRLLVQECLLDLGQRQREVLVLKYMEGLRVAEIAQRLSQTDEAIESLLARARESFRRAIGRRPDRSEVVQ